MWRIPLCDLNYDENEERAVIEVLRSKWLTMGPRTEEFEARASEYLGVKHAVAMCNCTCALETAYAIAKRRRGWSAGASPVRRGAPLIAVPDLTFAATVNAALAVGARPALTDIDELDSPLISPGRAAEILARERGDKLAVVIVHYAGFDCHSDEFARLAAEHDVMLIEDAAHGMGAWARSGRRLGATGQIGCFSFFSNKNLATGEGGMLVTSDDDIATEARLIRSHGMTSLTYDRYRRRSTGYDITAPGHNYRCSEITAALGIEQLRKLDRANAARRRLYKIYRHYLEGAPGVILPFSRSDETIDIGACHILPIVCRGGAMRDAVRKALGVANIQTSHHYPPVHTFSWYRRFLGEMLGDLTIPEGSALGDDFPPPESLRAPSLRWPVSLHYAAREITLPLYPALRQADVEEICSIVRRVAEN
ncbi:MAG: DegT/DnrJ/EryC1/StrS aminotransferase family protein [bacterium]